MNGPRIVNRQAAPMGALPTEYEALARALLGMQGEQRQAEYMKHFGNPASDGEYADAAMMARHTKLLPPWHRDISGKTPDEMGAGETEAGSGYYRPMDQPQEYSGFIDSEHDPWRGQRGGHRSQPTQRGVPVPARRLAP